MCVIAIWHRLLRGSYRLATKMERAMILQLDQKSSFPMVERTQHATLLYILSPRETKLSSKQEQFQDSKIHSQ